MYSTLDLAPTALEAKEGWLWSRHGGALNFSCLVFKPMAIAARCVYCIPALTPAHATTL